MKLTGNTVLITGGTSGIGRELAIQLSGLGNVVIITGRNQSKLDDMQRKHPDLIAIRSDVSDPSPLLRSMPSSPANIPR